MEYEYIKFKKENCLAMVTLNRPEKRNAMNGKVIEELLRALRYVANDDDIRVLIINGEGEHFCAGADIAWMQKMAVSSYNENYQDATTLANLMYQLYYFPKPTIVLAHGATMGGGLGLLSACDIAMAADNAVFSFSEVKIGLAPSTISPYVVTAIGERVANYYFLTGEKFNAEEAKRINLVHKTVANADLLKTGLSVAETLLLNAPNAVMSAKQLLRQISHEKIAMGLSHKTAEHLAGLRTSIEAQEGLDAFLEKRAPKWLAE